jgi:hypothetical protein
MTDKSQADKPPQPDVQSTVNRTSRVHESFVKEVMDTGAGLVHGAIELPVDGALQFANKVTGLGLPELQLVDQSRLNSVGGKVGTLLGTGIDAAALAYASGGLSVLGSIPNAARLAGAGAVYFGLLQPGDDSKSKSLEAFLKDRATNAAVGAITMGTAAISAPPISSLAPEAGSVLPNIGFRATVGGAFGGLYAETHAVLKEGRALPTLGELGTDVTIGAGIGAATGAIGALAGKLNHGPSEAELPNSDGAPARASSGGDEPGQVANGEGGQGTAKPNLKSANSDAAAARLSPNSEATIDGTPGSPNAISSASDLAAKQAPTGGPPGAYPKIDLDHGEILVTNGRMTTLTVNGDPVKAGATRPVSPDDDVRIYEERGTDTPELHVSRLKLAVDQNKALTVDDKPFKAGSMVQPDPRYEAASSAKETPPITYPFRGPDPSELEREQADIDAGGLPNRSLYGTRTPTGWDVADWRGKLVQSLRLSGKTLERYDPDNRIIQSATAETFTYHSPVLGDMSVESYDGTRLEYEPTGDLGKLAVGRSGQPNFVANRAADGTWNFEINKTGGPSYIAGIHNWPGKITVNSPDTAHGAASIQLFPQGGEPVELAINDANIFKRITETVLATSKVVKQGAPPTGPAVFVPS